MSEYKYKIQSVSYITISIKEHSILPEGNTMNSVIITPAEVISKGTSYPWTSYGEGFAVYNTSESFMFGSMNEFPEARRIHYPVHCGLYTNEQSTLTVPSNNKVHSCNNTNHNLDHGPVLGENTWSERKSLDLDQEFSILRQEYPEGCITVKDKDITEASTLCEHESFVEVSLRNIGVCSVAEIEKNVMEAITQYEHEDFIEVSLDVPLLGTPCTSPS